MSQSTAIDRNRLPFAGHCWMTREEARAFRKARPGNRLFVVLHPDFAPLPDDDGRFPNGRPLTDSAGRCLVAVGGCKFEDIPLRYLDWLSGQPWVYGELRQRLTAYLTQDVIQRELDAEFRDKEFESNGFNIVGVPTVVTERITRPVPGKHPRRKKPPMETVTVSVLKFTGGVHDHKWHGQAPPHEEPGDDYKPRKISRAQRWQWLAELALAIDNARLVHELPACENLAQLFAGLPFERVAQVRYAWELARRTLPTT